MLEPLAARKSGKGGCWRSACEYIYKRRCFFSASRLRSDISLLLGVFFQKIKSIPTAHYHTDAQTIEQVYDCRVSYVLIQLLSGNLNKLFNASFGPFPEKKESRGFRTEQECA
jgi:hypothetical protein